MFFASVTNFEDYQSRINRVSDSDLLDEYITLCSMLDGDVRSSFCLEIVDSFMNIVGHEIINRYVNMLNGGHTSIVFRIDKS